MFEEMTEEMIQEKMDEARYYDDLARYAAYDDEMCDFEDAPEWEHDWFVA